jgi:nicotinate-nucleotide adenylyltransferase
MTVESPRIGLFGGSFDPPHLGHRALAEAALLSLSLDEVRWIPAGAPWQKTDRALADAAHRAAMVELAIAGESRFALDERELRRAGPSYTIDTVREIQAERPGAALFLIIGQDQYARLHTWHEWSELLGRVMLAVVARNGQPPIPGAAVMNQRHRIEVLSMPRVDVSATLVRQRAETGADLAALVGPAVAGYIERHQLYRGDAPH